MNNRERIIYGFVITALIFLTANVVGGKLHLGGNFLPGSFVTHITMLLLSIVAIRLTGNKSLNFRIATPKLKKIVKPFFIGVIITITVNILMTVITKLVGGEIMPHPLLLQMNALQTFLFVFVLASIAEEFLFRGFLQNALKSLSQHSITIFKTRLSLPVIIGGVTFGLAHLILILTGVDCLFLTRIVLFTTILGIAAGYYQEKYDNTAYAIVVHMGGNLLGIFSALVMNMQ